MFQARLFNRKLQLSSKVASEKNSFRNIFIHGINCEDVLSIPPSDFVLTVSRYRQVIKQVNEVPITIKLNHNFYSHRAFRAVHPTLKVFNL